MNEATQLTMLPNDRPPAVMTPMDMLDRAIASGQSMEVLEKLMALQERWEKNNARKAFDAAIAAAKAEIPVITKNRTGHNTRYADFAAIAKVVDPILGKHGLSYRFRTTQNGTISVTCILSHNAGHSEDNTLSANADTSGSKNAIQSLGSTLTYLQRYSLVQALGLAASDDDDGKAAGAAPPEYVTAEQDDELKALIAKRKEPDKALDWFLRFFRIESTADLPARDFDQAKNILLKPVKSDADH